MSEMKFNHITLKTDGFNHFDTDCIVLCRPAHCTLKYTDKCKVLNYAGTIIHRVNLFPLKLSVLIF